MPPDAFGLLFAALGTGLMHQATFCNFSSWRLSKISLPSCSLTWPMPSTNLEEACEVTQGTHRGGDHYWAEKVAESKILQFDPSALKAATGQLAQDSSG